MPIPTLSHDTDLAIAALRLPHVPMRTTRGTQVGWWHRLAAMAEHAAAGRDLVASEAPRGYDPAAYARRHDRVARLAAIGCLVSMALIFGSAYLRTTPAGAGTWLAASPSEAGTAAAVGAVLTFLTAIVSLSVLIGSGERLDRRLSCLARSWVVGPEGVTVHKVVLGEPRAVLVPHAAIGSTLAFAGVASLFDADGKVLTTLRPRTLSRGGSTALLPSLGNARDLVATVDAARAARASA